MFETFDDHRSRYASGGIVQTLPSELIDSIWTKGTSPRDKSILELAVWIGIYDKTTPIAAIIVPSVQTCSDIFRFKKNSSFRIITIHKGEVLDTSTRHNSYVRMIETGTKGLEYSHSQPLQTPLCD